MNKEEIKKQNGKWLRLYQLAINFLSQYPKDSDIKDVIIDVEKRLKTFRVLGTKRSAIDTWGRSQ